MKSVQFENLFETTNNSVFDFFTQYQGLAYYIPEYQRDYSWDKENIYQLLEDIEEGTQRMLDESGNAETRFLGSIITVSGEGLKNRDPKGNPTKVEMIIDGQQRVITIIIIATLFTKRLLQYKKAIKKTSEIFSEIAEIVDEKCNELVDIVSWTLSRGTPKCKPILIRGGEDYWTATGKKDDAYHSDISNYIASFLEFYIKQTGNEKSVFPNFRKETHYYDNSSIVDGWLKEIGDAHKNDNKDYPNALEIIKKMPQELLWGYEKPDLIQIIDEHFHNIVTKESDTVCSLVQTLVACYYLMQRCCFCVIKAKNEDSAFDMFQSLNATGTPLTAMETFKPIIINKLKLNNIEYKGSETEKNFDRVEKYVSATKTAVDKTKRTNEFIVSFFVAYNGTKVPAHFSGERAALKNSFDDELDSIEDRELFIKKMGDYSEFNRLWNDYNPTSENNECFSFSGCPKEADLASLLIHFNKKSGHKMAITTLGTIYQEVIDKKQDADLHFIEVVKGTTAFYFLWRSLYSNNGLDVPYRELFKDCRLKTKTSTEIKSFLLNAFIKKIVKEENLDKNLSIDEAKKIWMDKATTNLRYKKNDDFIRLALLIASTDTIPDTDNIGSLKKSKTGVSNYLTLEKWLSPSLKSIEHIAPQTKTESWNPMLYENDLINSLGNLTLLPQDLNSSVGNKEWKVKLLYYKSVSEGDPDTVSKIESEAKKQGVELNKDTIEKLRNCSYNSHMKSISVMESYNNWDAEIVKKRTNAILEVIWDKLISWIE